MSRAYERLAERFSRIGVLAEAEGVLAWDAAAMMPLGGGRARGDQLAVLAGIAHGLLTAPGINADLDAAEAAGLDSNSSPDPWRAANLRLMRHAARRAAAVPGGLVEAAARANSACEKIWRGARMRADYAAVLPTFIEVVRLAREQAAVLGAALGLTPYDALMDGYQPGIGAAEVGKSVRALRALPCPRPARGRGPSRPAAPALLSRGTLPGGGAGSVLPAAC